MLEFLIESIFVGFGGKICQQSVGILMGIYCTPSMSIFSFTRIRSSLCKNTEAKAFNLTFRYIDDALSMNHQNFANCLNLVPLMLPKNTRSKKQQKTTSSASFPDILIKCNIIWLSFYQIHSLHCFHYKFSAP